MKKSIIFSGLLASLLLVGCANKPAENEGSSSNGSSTTEPSTPAVVPVTGVSIEGKDFVGIGKEVPFTAKIAPDNATTKTVTWSTSDATKATVTEDGKVTGVAAGKVKIIAKSTADETKIAEKEIEVCTYIGAVKWKDNDFQHVNILNGESFKITDVKVYPEDATNKTLVWSSDDETVATVDQEGNITTKAVGSCYVKATSATGKYLKLMVHSVVKPTEIGIKFDDVDVTGKTVEIHLGTKPTFKGKYASDNDYHGANWSSSNAKVATIDKYGNITPVAEGETVITIVSSVAENVKNTCTVKVLPALPKPVGLFEFDDLKYSNGKFGDMVNGTDKLIVNSSYKAYSEGAGADKHALKLGSSSTDGKIEFTVPTGYTKAELYVAKWDKDESKITVAGNETVVTVLKSATEWQKITVDLPADGKLAISAVKRVLIDKIQFVK